MNGFVLPPRWHCLLPTSFCFLLLFSRLLSADAQPTSISGFVNQATAVTAINGGNNILTVGNASGLSLDERVLIIQMQGASISSSNSSTFGSITNIGTAGRFEFATVCEANGGTNEVSLQDFLSHTYDPVNGSVQLIRVARYEDAVVSGTLQAPPWNGSTGGIIVLEVADTLRLEADIDVSGSGFRGGTFVNMDEGCNFFSDFGDYAYELLDGRGGQKGEGIAAYISNQEYGRGRQANGGGGGNEHNAGGGGGAGYASGGQGGDRVTTGFNCRGVYQGVGGLALSSVGYSSANPYVFFGGGGGAGQGNSFEGQDAGNGGGIVIIRCGTFDGNGFSILANGLSALDADSDGGSGGGGGGSILLETTQYTPAGFNLEAQGGGGGNTDINCEGPGGGGGGGAIWSSQAFNAGVSRDLSGGTAGQAQGGGCGNSAQNATAGQTGAELANFSLSEGNVTAPCALPLELLGWEAERQADGIQLSWLVAKEEMGTTYQIERATDGQPFRSIHTQIVSEAADFQAYNWLDEFPWPGQARYRLRWQEPDGQQGVSRQIEISFDLAQSFQWRVFPQPLRSGTPLQVELAIGQQQAFQIRLLGLLGQEIWQANPVLKAGRHALSFPLPQLSAGIYLLEIRGSSNRELIKLWVQ